MATNQNSLRIRSLYRIALSIITSIFAFGALVLPIALRPDTLPLKVGQVSPATIVAPRDLSYTSEILTEKNRDQARNSVQPIYLPADPSIARTQIDNLHLALNFIKSVRTDPNATVEQKMSDLKKLSNLPLTDDEINKIIGLTNTQWQILSQESIRVLELILRNNIRDYQVTEYQKNIPSYTSYTLTNEEIALVQTLVSPFVFPNSIYSKEETQKAQQIASDSVVPIIKKYSANQTIVTRGQLISEEQFEVLSKFGLAQTKTKTQDLISAFSIVLLVSVFLVLYFNQRNLKLLKDLRSLTVIVIGFILFLYGARFLVPNRTIVPYFFPLPAYALILATLFSLEISVIFSIPLGILAAFGLTNSAELTIFYLFTSVFASILLGNGRRFTNFIYSSLAIGVSGSLCILSYHLSDPSSDSIGIITLIIVSFLNGIASASIALLAQYLLSQLMGLPTPLHLMDLARPDHPLQKYLLQNAPGTYQHSLQVSNLAEIAAEAIGANPLLTRVGTIYHDVGKAMNSSFYIENQIPGHLNPHDDMNEIEAARQIIDHVTLGAKLAEKYHLPPRIKDFIFEHHGTQITRYPYNRALEKNNNDATKVDESQFKYPGPKPQSKETAILMLADGCEARARAELPSNSEEMRKLVEKVFNRCLQEGQLDNSPLTLKDLDLIKESFINTLNNSHHPRMIYPDVENTYGKND
ncbi:MAG: HDIG domain-containing protein [Candidatus Atribacteria bacterium]|nr:HDIG domain-containing protein [Candidatus Atribacteria bacterium]